MVKLLAVAAWIVVGIAVAWTIGYLVALVEFDMSVGVVSYWVMGVFWMLVLGVVFGFMSRALAALESIAHSTKPPAATP